MNWAWTSGDNERLSIWNGSFAMVSMSIVNGFVAIYLLDGLHATNGQMGLLSSLPNLVNLFSMLAAAAMLRRSRSKKRFCANATMVSRSFYVFIAIVPWLPIHNAALLVVWLVALTRVPQSFGDLSWQAMIGDLIRPERRSNFFSERNRILTLVGLVTTFLAGLLLQQFDKHATAPYQAVFLATVFFAVMEVLFLLKHDESTGEASAILPEPGSATASATKQSSQMTWLRALRDKRFLIVVGALLWFNFGWQMSWPLFSIYQITTAHAPAMWVGMFTVANSLSQVLSFRWWGRMAERHGNGKMLALAAVGMATAPVLTIASTNMYYLLLVNLFTGVPVAGTTLLIFNYLLEVSPERDRTAYISYYNVVLSVIGFAAPEVGIFFLGHIGMTEAMWISTTLRLTGAILFWVVAVW
ncbi:MAG: hypothetical protein A2201_12525, partial [Alicyclobacillus sp. RIFOXYA1_FULL_53_8]